MELNTYQKRAMGTCMPSSNNDMYMLLNLVGELGEFASKLAKSVRKDYLQVQENNFIGINTNLKNELKKEAGDILWQLSGLCNTFGWNLEDVAQMNLEKLSSRAKRDVIDGSGDNR